jgi:hypothetical protein
LGPRRGAAAAREVRLIARANGAGVAATGVRAARLRRSGGFRLAEAAARGLFDPAVPVRTATLHASKRDALAAQARVNPPALAHLTEDKAVFAAHCAARGLPCAATLGFLRGTSAWPSGGARIDGAEAVGAWLAGSSMPDGFVVKPVDGYWGLGVRIVRREAGVLRVRGAGAVEPEALVARVAAERPGADHLVQELVANRADVVEVLGPAAVHTFRVITLLDRGTPRVLAAYLRAARSADGTDNFRGGATGNLHCEVDGDGRVTSVWRSGGARRGLEEVRGEGAGGPPPGWAVPWWPEVRELALEAAAAFAPVAAIGWDVAMTPGGALLIEANARWDPVPLPGARAVVDAVRAAG